MINRLRKRFKIPPRDELRQKIYEIIDNRVRIITAGLSLRELRAVLRGDPPTEKPNPRYRVITTSFIAHLRPRFYQAASTRFTHTFRLGWFVTFFFIVEVITGVILMFYYIPFPDQAYESILNIESNVFFGELMRDLHRLGAEAMVLFTGLHLFRTYMTGSYKGPRSFTWLTGVILLLITGWLSFTGYLLTWDQLGYWAITVGSSMAEAGPIVGPATNLLLRGAPDIGTGGLLRFYLQHVILFPLLAILLISIHYYKVSREHSISLPATVEEGDLPPDIKKKETRRIDLIPDLLTHELFLVSFGVFIMLLILFAGWFHSPLETHANPQKTPLDTKAPWYFWWLQGLLKIDPAKIIENLAGGFGMNMEISHLLNSKFIMGLVLPPVLILLLLAIPYIDRNPSRLARKRPFAVVWGIAWVFIFLTISFMGTPQFAIETPPATRIIQDLAPEEGLGPLREIPHAELVGGIYVVGEDYGRDLCPDLVYFTGTVKSIKSNAWVVDNEVIAVNPSTHMDEEIGGGSLVTVQAFVNQAGQVEAREIRLAKEDSDGDKVTLGCPHLTEVFNIFSERLREAEAEGELPDLYAQILVEDYAPGLKRVVPSVAWTTEEGKSTNYEVHFYMHAEGRRYE